MTDLFFQKIVFIILDQNFYNINNKTCNRIEKHDNTDPHQYLTISINSDKK